MVVIIENTFTHGASAITSIGDEKILVGNKSGMISLWQYFRSGILLHIQNYTGDEKEIRFIVSFFERKFISVNENSEIRVWETSSGICERVLSGGYGSVNVVNSVVVLPNKLLIVSGNCSPAWECFDVWDLELGRCIYGRKHESHRPYGMSLKTTAQGFLVVAGHCSNTLSVWQIDHSDCKLVNEGKIERIYSMATLPTGEIVAANHDLNFYEISNDVQICKSKTLENGNVIDYIYPIGGYKILTIDRSNFCSNTIKLRNYLSRDCDVLGSLGREDPRGLVLLEQEGTILSLCENKIYIHEFLECCFHFPKPLAEIRKNARILSQAYRTGTSSFASLPIEINLKIAVLTTFDKMNKWEKEVSEKIAENYFSKPSVR